MTATGWLNADGIQPENLLDSRLRKGLRSEALPTTSSDLDTNLCAGIQIIFQQLTGVEVSKEVQQST